MDFPSFFWQPKAFRSCFKDHLQMWQIGWCIRPWKSHPSCKPPLHSQQEQGNFKINLMNGIQGFSGVTSSHSEGFFIAVLCIFCTKQSSPLGVMGLQIPMVTVYRCPSPQPGWVESGVLSFYLKQIALRISIAISIAYIYISISTMYIYNYYTYSIHVSYIYRNFPWKSSIHLGKYSILYMDGIGYKFHVQ